MSLATKLSTESIARVCAQSPWRVIGIWVALALLGVYLIIAELPGVETTDFVFVSNPEPKIGRELLEDRLRGPAGTNEVVVIESDSLTVDDPAFRELVEVITRDVAAFGPDVVRLETLTNYYRSGAASLVSEDRSAAIIPFVMAGDFDIAAGNIKDVVDKVKASDGTSGIRVMVTGQAAASLETRDLGQQDLEKGEAFGVPIALVILILALGAVAAAFIPLVLAAFVIAVALGAAALVGQAFEMSFFVRNIVTMIGLAVGIDYTLFVVARYREERARGLEKIEAISRAGRTATRTVVFSGITVVLALAGMLLVPFNIFIAVGVGSILVVLAAMAASLTLLPAVLGLLGDRLNALALPIIGRAQARHQPSAGGGFWDRAAHIVMVQPVVSLVVAGGLLIAMAVPLLDLNPGFAGVSTLPDRLDSKQAFLVLDEKFSFGEVTPAEVVIDGDIDSPEVRGAVDRLIEFLDADPGFRQPRPLQVNPERDLALLSVPANGDSTTKDSLDAVRRLDAVYVEEAFAGVDADVYVTGEAAFNAEFFDLAARSVRVVFPFVLGVSFLLLTVVFRSILLPIKAIALNLLSVGAAYGLLVLVFQKGWSPAFLGFQQSPVIEAWIPLFLFTILFGLSMDYHVFMLSRIRERYDETRDNVDAVAFGIRSTGRLITGAALIMVAVFWGFAAGELVGLQQMGLGLGIAILLDATIVRAVLVPASMRLLGSWNWYLPSWLSWIPDFRVEPPEVPAASTAE